MSEAPQILLAHHLKKLKLPTFLREHEKIARLCAAENKGHTRDLLRLAELELIDREGRMVERRIKAARFPTVKSLDSFDFKAIPSLNKPLVLELARGPSHSGRIAYLSRRASTSHTRSGTVAIKVSKRCQLKRRSRPGTRHAAIVASHCLSALPPAWKAGLRAS